MKHTPTPWQIDERSGCLAIYPATDKHTCLSGASSWAIHFSDQGAHYNGSHWTMDPEAVANARYIVRAVNAHDALVKACNMVFDYDENVHKDVREAIRAALALAEGSDEN